MVRPPGLDHDLASRSRVRDGQDESADHRLVGFGAAEQFGGVAALGDQAGDDLAYIADADEHLGLVILESYGMTQIGLGGQFAHRPWFASRGIGEAAGRGGRICQIRLDAVRLDDRRLRSASSEMLSWLSVPCIPSLSRPRASSAV